MRILVFGKTGQVARELAGAKWPRHCTLTQLGRDACDLTDAAAIGRVISDTGPAFVVNAAAYTAVDRAESEPDLAGMVNRDAPAAMAAACEHSGAVLIHLSTDYVFDGTKSGAYLESDSVAPLSVYGRTKAEGEAQIRATLERHVMLRTSWVFAAHGANFVRTILRLAGEREELRIVADQKGAPTAARDIAAAIVQVASSVTDGTASWGTFHFTSGAATTWHGFAKAILDLSGHETRLVPITTAEYKTAARRPPNSVLDCGRLARDYGIGQPSWQHALKDVLEEMAGLNRPKEG